MTMGQRKSFGLFLFDDSSLAQILYTADVDIAFRVVVRLCQCSMHSPRDYAPLYNCPIIADRKALNREIVRAQWVIEVCNMLMQMA